MESKVVSIADVAEIVLGGTPNTKIPEYWNGTIKWATAKDVSSVFGKYLYNTEKSITELGLEKSPAKILEKDTIVISARGTVGKFCMLPYPMAFNQTCYGLIAKQDIIDPHYLYYNLFCLSEQINSLSYGTTFNTITKKTFHDIKFRLPPLPEQQKIASILSAFDDKIELNNEMNKTLEEMAQAIFKHWFIDFEFPNENGEPYKSSGGEFVNSELGPIPKGWKVTNLREILDNVCDSVKHGKELEGLPYVPIDIIDRKSIALKQFKSWEEAQSSLIKFKKDDILLGAMRVYFHKVSIAPCEGITRKTCFVLRPKKGFDLSYTLLLIFQDDTIEFADAHSKGTTMPYAVWDNGLAEMKIALPTESIRKKFNDFLYPIISKIRDCVFENLTLSQLRDTLLPKLISGEIRVV